MFRKETLFFPIAFLMLLLFLTACDQRHSTLPSTFGEVFRVAAARDVRALIGYCSHPEIMIRRFAVATIAEIGDKQASKQLEKSIGDKDEFVREAAVHGLGVLRDTTAKVTLKKSLHDPSLRVRLAAAWALAQTGDFENAMFKLLLSERDLEKQFHLGMLSYLLAATNLVKAHEEAYTNDLLLSLGPTPSMAHEWIAKHGREQVIKDLVSTIEDDSHLLSVRLVAAHSLGTIKAKEGVQPLLRVIKESNSWPLRLKSLVVLGVIKDNSSVRPLIDLINTSEDFRLRSHIAITLGYIGDKQAVESLMEILVSPGVVGTRAFRPLLFDYRVQAEWMKTMQEIQVSAATALGRIGDRRAETILRVFADPTFRSELSRKTKADKLPELVDRAIDSAARSGAEVQKAASEALTMIHK